MMNQYGVTKLLTKYFQLASCGSFRRSVRILFCKRLWTSCRGKNHVNKSFRKDSLKNNVIVYPNGFSAATNLYRMNSHRHLRLNKSNQVLQTLIIVLLFIIFFFFRFKNHICLVDGLKQSKLSKTLQPKLKFVQQQNEMIFFLLKIVADLILI